MAKRIRSEKPALITIKDWQQADEMVRNIADCQIAIEKLEAIAKVKIDRTKKILAEAVKGHQGTIKNCQASLEAFATAHREDFKKQKSRRLNFGVIGWRKSTPAMMCMSPAKIKIRPRSRSQVRASVMLSGRNTPRSPNPPENSTSENRILLRRRSPPCPEPSGGSS